ALKVIFPEIDALFGVPQPPQHHPEIDTGIHALMVLNQACRLSDHAEVRLAALLHDLGKAVTPSQHWPSHHGHEKKGLPILEKLCKRLRIPKTFKTLATHVMEYHTHCHRAFELRPDTLADMLHNIGGFKSHQALENFVLACEADARGRTGFEHRDYPQADYLRCACQAAVEIDTSAILNSPLQGQAIGTAIRDLRIQTLKQFKQDYLAAQS
ncbi:MAG: multifunctional tRNA nucleotidyl transferase/23-cyclic, partial [Pseudomonadota bacterium]